MIVDTCAQLRTYERFFGLLAERFCRLRKEFQQAFEQIARDTYNTIHRFDITKLRNMARFVAHLLCTDAISWNVRILFPSLLFHQLVFLFIIFKFTFLFIYVNHRFISMPSNTQILRF